MDKEGERERDARQEGDVIKISEKTFFFERERQPTAFGGMKHG